MEITLNQLVAYCQHHGLAIRINPNGSVRTKLFADTWEDVGLSELRERIAASEGVQIAAPAPAAAMPAPFIVAGYEELSAVLLRAFEQAAKGKGKERHANGEPFHEQVMQTGAHRFGVGALLFQAFKKSEESQRLPHDRAVAELLGAIVYLAGAVIHMERRQRPDERLLTGDGGGIAAQPRGAIRLDGRVSMAHPANDNTPRCCSDSSKPQTFAGCDGCSARRHA